MAAYFSVCKSFVFLDFLRKWRYFGGRGVPEAPREHPWRHSWRLVPILDDFGCILGGIGRPFGTLWDPGGPHSRHFSAPRTPFCSTGAASEAPRGARPRKSSKNRQKWMILGQAGMQSVHACAVQTHFSIFPFFLTKGTKKTFEMLPFRHFLAPLGTLGHLRGRFFAFWDALARTFAHSARAGAILREMGCQGGGPKRRSAARRRPC